MSTTLSRTDVLRELEGEVGVLIRRIRRVIGERARSVHPELLPASYLMLGYVRDNGPVRASAIGQVFDIDKGAISRQVQHLIDLGLIDRQPDPADGRATLLTASAEAVERMDSVAAERRRRLADRLDDWTPEEMSSFVATLRRYNQALSEPGDH
ncbi:DNA-binding MarR family transcriptional regulator [Nocardioides sp. J9]|uniref:MarR family winged helix-turn-helix transcriptional regulator n=1 Tax=unclassified Nocardioides TaxID=2615069 RepID=UPI0004AC8B17|nr:MULTISPECIES: MarR family transcriptional regulator [unclassified Nocardioides]TWH01948.1 DNA-binding MarR family transcriptional regulator [Nocardioides sp. J9]